MNHQFSQLTLECVNCGMSMRTFLACPDNLKECPSMLSNKEIEEENVRRLRELNAGLKVQLRKELADPKKHVEVPHRCYYCNENVEPSNSQVSRDWRIGAWKHDQCEVDHHKKTAEEQRKANARLGLARLRRRARRWRNFKSFLSRAFWSVW
jgi:hypothetical protein